MKVLNFGSLNIDYVYKVEHFVSPGETILSNDFEIFCGGKGLNQSIALKKAGVDVYHAGKVGDNSDLLLNRLREFGVNTDFIQRESGPTGHAIIQLDKTGQNCIILHGGANQTMTKEFIDSVIDNFSKGDIILLQNEINLLDYIIEKAHKKGMRIALNPSPINESIEKLDLSPVTWLLLNEVEGKALSGCREDVEIAAELNRRYPDTEIILTLGSEGVLYSSRGKTLSHRAYETKVVDTTGAGDTFTGYFIAAMTQELPVEEALKLASLAASIAVSREGASDSVPYMKEVLEICTKQS
jgi:ribokinase